MEEKHGWPGWLFACRFCPDAPGRGTGRWPPESALSTVRIVSLPRCACRAATLREPNLYYPRVKQLSDGSLLLCFMNDHFGWDIYVSRSEDGGLSWSDAQLLLEKYSTTSTVGEDPNGLC